MLIFIVPALLLSLPTLVQAGTTFWRLRSHDSERLWVIFFWAVPAQLLAGVAATVVSVQGFSQKGIQCATGAAVFLVGGVVLAATATPFLSLLAALIRWLPRLRPNH